MAVDPYQSKESSITRTSKHIAFLLIGLYGVALIIIGAVAAIKSSPDDSAWIDLFKSGFLILGGGLTTVVGYYFGSRGVQEAEQNVVRTQQEMETLKKDTESKLVEYHNMLKSQIPTYDETSLIPPEEYNDRSAGNGVQNQE